MDCVALGSHYASWPCPHRARPAASPVRRGRGAPDPGPARKTDADERTDVGASRTGAAAGTMTDP